MHGSFVTALAASVTQTAPSSTPATRRAVEEGRSVDEEAAVVAFTKAADGHPGKTVASPGTCRRARLGPAGAVIDTGTTGTAICLEKLSPEDGRTSQRKQICPVTQQAE